MADNNCIPIKIKTVVELTDPEYFCSKSWTLSFNFNTKTWVSFHSYIPNWYVAENNFFYSGLNGGCDLEALAIEEIPYTTSSTTTYCIGCKPPETTTSTTTVYVDCTLEGFAVIQPNPTTTSTSSSSTTSSTSTTSTTTTLCLGCTTYEITNSTEAISVFTVNSCYNNTEYNWFVNPLSSTNICSCSDPVLPVGLSFSIIGSGCITHYCYTITNNTESTIAINYIDSNNIYREEGLSALSSVQLCAQQDSISTFPGEPYVTVLGGTIPCTTLGDCPTTSTTTTIIPS